MFYVENGNVVYIEMSASQELNGKAIEVARF